MNVFRNHKYSRRDFTQRAASHQPHGAATSAAKVAGRSGVLVRPNQIWIPGEGWVYWPVIEKQVTQAFRNWCVKQQRKAMRLQPA